jgi:hypothetical protein
MVEPLPYPLSPFIMVELARPCMVGEHGTYSKPESIALAKIIDEMSNLLSEKFTVFTVHFLLSSTVHAYVNPNMPGQGLFLGPIAGKVHPAPTVSTNFYNYPFIFHVFLNLEVCYIR